MQETRRRELLRLIEKHISFASVRHSAKSKKEDVFRPGPENWTGEIRALVELSGLNPLRSQLVVPRSASA
jgi:hypothetical protein